MTTTESSARPEADGHRRGRESAVDDRADEAADSAQRHHEVVARWTDQGLHFAEDLIYSLTGLLLVAGAVVVLVQAVYKFATTVSDGVLEAIDASIGSLLIVFILVELLSAVRTIITERKLVAEPFLIVGILAAIKEMVTVATFRIKDANTEDVLWKIGVLAAVVIGLAVAILILRRSRGQSPVKDQKEQQAPA